MRLAYFVHPSFSMYRLSLSLTPTFLILKSKLFFFSRKKKNDKSHTCSRKSQVLPRRLKKFRLSSRVPRHSLLSLHMSVQFSTMDQSTIPITPDMLYDFLVAVPNVCKDKLTKEMERQVLTNCYRSLWANDLGLMQQYFFKEGLPEGGSVTTLLEKYNLFHHDDSTAAAQANPESELTNAEEDGPEYLESQRGKQCGHLFKSGESVYRCRYGLRHLKDSY